MTQRDQSDSAVKTYIALNGGAGGRLRELAADAGVSPGRMAKEILEEILPKIETVQRRVAIKLRGAAQ